MTQILMYHEAHSCIELIPIANWWATTELLMILHSRTFQPGGRCHLLALVAHQMAIGNLIQTANWCWMWSYKHYSTAAHHVTWSLDSDKLEAVVLIFCHIPRHLLVDVPGPPRLCHRQPKTTGPPLCTSSAHHRRVSHVSLYLLLCYVGIIAQSQRMHTTPWPYMLGCSFIAQVYKIMCTYVLYRLLLLLL